MRHNCQLHDLITKVFCCLTKLKFSRFNIKSTVMLFLLAEMFHWLEFICAFTQKIVIFLKSSHFTIN